MGRWVELTVSHWCGGGACCRRGGEGACHRLHGGDGRQREVQGHASSGEQRRWLARREWRDFRREDDNGSWACWGSRRWWRRPWSRSGFHSPTTSPTSAARTRTRSRRAWIRSSAPQTTNSETISCAWLLRDPSRQIDLLQVHSRMTWFLPLLVPSSRARSRRNRSVFSSLADTLPLLHIASSSSSGWCRISAASKLATTPTWSRTRAPVAELTGTHIITHKTQKEIPILLQISATSSIAPLILLHACKRDRWWSRDSRLDSLDNALVEQKL